MAGATAQVKLSLNGEITGYIDWDIGSMIYGLRLSGIRTLFCCSGHKVKQGYISFVAEGDIVTRRVIKTIRAYGFKITEVCEIDPQPEYEQQARTAIYWQA